MIAHGISGIWLVVMWGVETGCCVRITTTIISKIHRADYVREPYKVKTYLISPHLVQALAGLPTEPVLNCFIIGASKEVQRALQRRRNNPTATNAEVREANRRMEGILSCLH
jgi:hypothetical protein